ncbi:MAG TPA: hypothetical protein VFP55_06610 [Solirubrobacteraceae bacterium]|nr:hypothetical protein [Solirubrobacteraceae bacterium]
MPPTTLARALGLARVAVGVGLIAQPGRLTTAWLGRDAKAAGTQVAVRGLGARDLVLGAGTAIASGSDRQRWLIAGIVGDVADLTATLAAGRALPARGRVLVAALAGAGVAMGATALAGLRG